MCSLPRQSSAWLLGSIPPRLLSNRAAYKAPYLPECTQSGKLKTWVVLLITSLAPKSLLIEIKKLWVHFMTTSSAEPLRIEVRCIAYLSPYGPVGKPAPRDRACTRLLIELEPLYKVTASLSGARRPLFVHGSPLRPLTATS